MKKIIGLIITTLLVVLLALYSVAASVYKSSFNYRCNTDSKDAFEMRQFPEMKRDRHTFQSNKGQTLVGYLYESNDYNIDVKGVVIFAHGLGGGGQIGYLDVFDFMVKNGYVVFAYDATGNDESEGEVIGGLPQGIIDLDYAISYAQTIEKIQDLPFVLMGYSWGGLSVANALNYHPDIRAVVSLAGFNRSMNLIEHRAGELAGNYGKLLLPFGFLYEFFNYGKYACCTGIHGFKNSDCGVMVVHSGDDTMVPIKYGYDAYHEQFSENRRFTFKRYKNRGHNIYRNRNNALDESLFDEIVSFLDRYVEEFQDVDKRSD